MGVNVNRHYYRKHGRAWRISCAGVRRVTRGSGNYYSLIRDPKNAEATSARVESPIRVFVFLLTAIFSLSSLSSFFPLPCLPLLRISFISPFIFVSFVSHAPAPSLIIIAIVITAIVTSFNEGIRRS
jgi:hypothetical protein